MAITWPGRNVAPDWPIYLFPDNTLSTVLLRDDVVSGSKLWRYGGSNPRPFTCKANALPLSYIPSWRIGKWRKLFRKLHIQRRVKGVERYKKNAECAMTETIALPWPGFEPGLSRPQREVLTTIRSRPLHQHAQMQSIIAAIWICERWWMHYVAPYGCLSWSCVLSGCICILPFNTKLCGRRWWYWISR